MRVMTFSTKFPSYHPRKGEWTHFVPKIWKSINMLPITHEYSDYFINYYRLKQTDELVSYCKLKDVIPKGHTIRKGHRWKAGDWFQPVIWGDDINIKSGRSGPYQSKQIKFAPPIEAKKVWDIEIKGPYVYLDNRFYTKDTRMLEDISKNDGLIIGDFLNWFKYPCHPHFDGQIICWNDKIEY